MSNSETINILIVDDSRNNLFTLHTLIKEYVEANILQANSGTDALKILLKESVDLILLDVQMPDLDGFETAKAIRSRKKTQHIPIVFLTAAYKAEEFKDRGFEMGGVDYLTKPIDPTQLISRIKTYVRFIEQDRLHNQELERKIQERTSELIKARNELERRVTERTIELVLAKEKAEQAQEIAESANRAKSRFLANMSHELRTPLNAIIGYCEILLEEAEESSQEIFIADLQKIQDAGKHLLGLISDVLDFSKIEAGKMQLSLEYFAIEEVLKEVVAIAQPLIEKRNNTLIVNHPPELGQMHSDMTKLRQMLLHLLSNAAKFTDHGTIRLEIKSPPDWVIFSVIDNGIGMTIEQQKRLFRPFTQADSSSTRRYGGSGLGLAVTKEFAQMMGGHISVTSEFGQGSTLSISLPLQVTNTMEPKPTENVQPPPDSMEGDGIVLVITHEETAREVLKNDLGRLGYAVAVAARGEEGLKLARKLHPDAILLDVQGNNQEGWQILSELKIDSSLSHVPVIIINLEDQATRGYALGTPDYVTKPISFDKLTALLEKYHGGSESRNLVMVVDDEEFVRKAMAALLKARGWRVFQAENGQVALENLDDTKPALILLDLKMPVMDGFEFVNRLQENPQWRATPVVVLTARHLSAEELARLNNSVETIFNKESYDKDDLILHIHKLISNSSLLKKEEFNLVDWK